MWNGPPSRCFPFIDTIKDRTAVTAQDFSTVREQFRLMVASVKGATGIVLEIGARAGSRARSRNRPSIS